MVAGYHTQRSRGGTGFWELSETFCTNAPPGVSSPGFLLWDWCPEVLWDWNPGSLQEKRAGPACQQKEVSNERIFNEDSVAEWSACGTQNPAVPGSSPPLTTSWICFSVTHEFKSSAPLVNNQVICFWPVGKTNQISDFPLEHSWAATKWQ